MTDTCSIEIKSSYDKDVLIDMLSEDISKNGIIKFEGQAIYKSVIKNCFFTAKGRDNYEDMVMIMVNLLGIFQKDYLSSCGLSLKHQAIFNAQADCLKKAEDKKQGSRKYCWADLFTYYLYINLINDITEPYSIFNKVGWDEFIDNYVHPEIINLEILHNQYRGDIEANYKIYRLFMMAPMIRLPQSFVMTMKYEFWEILIQANSTYKEAITQSLASGEINMKEIFFYQQNLSRFFQFFQILYD